MTEPLLPADSTQASATRSRSTSVEIKAVPKEGVPGMFIITGVFQNNLGYFERSTLYDKPARAESALKQEVSAAGIGGFQPAFAGY